MNRILMILILVIVISGTASGLDDYQKFSDYFGVTEVSPSLPEEAMEYLENNGPEKNNNFFSGIKHLLKNVGPKVVPSLKDAGEVAVRIFAIILICSLLAALKSDSSDTAVRIAGVFAISLCVVSDAKVMIGLGQSVINDYAVFSNALFPILAGTAASAGNVNASATIYSVAAFAFNLFIVLFQKLFLPMISILLSLHIAAAAVKNDMLSQLSKTISDLLKNFLRFTMLGFSVLLSVTRITGGTADAFAVKTAKITTSTVVPVVGGMISDAAETVILGAQMVKNSVGVFGMLAAIAILAVPFLRVGAQYLMLQICAFFASAIGMKEHCSLLFGICSCLGNILGLVFCCGVMVFLSCICFMKVNIQ